MSKKEIDELVAQFDKVYIRGTRPTELITPERYELPGDLLIFNAPRPLSGSRIRYGQGFYEWMGDFHHGTLYAAVDPDDPEAPRWLRENLDGDGWLVHYTTIDEARAWLKTYYAGALRGETDHMVDDASDKDVWASFVDHNRKVG